MTASTPPARGAHASEEIELRLATTDAALRRLARVLAETGATVSAPRIERLHSVYFDTPDLALRESGAALRLRRVDGEAALTQTLKCAAADSPFRREYEGAVASWRPDLALARRLGWRGGAKIAAREAELRPVFATRVARTVRRVEFAGALVEVAVDRGTLEVERGAPARGSAANR